MQCATDAEKQNLVALHPEGVDRNAYSEKKLEAAIVALHPEGVDRNNIYAGGAQWAVPGRPPPGGRG